MGIILDDDYRIDDLQLIQNKIGEFSDILKNHYKRSDPVERIFAALTDAGLRKTERGRRGSRREKN